MKCAREILEIKKIADFERAEKEHQEAAAKALALAKRREEAKVDTFEYAKKLVNSLINQAKNGQEMKIVCYYEGDGEGLHRAMCRWDRSPYSNGVRPWSRNYEMPALNLDYLMELLTGLCYDVKRDIGWLYVNSYRTEKFTRIIISVPSSLPCD